MALVNFRLKHPDTIIPWGDAPDTSMHWFGLTEGEYWLDFNKATLYEYTKAISADGVPYVEFQVARLLEDWTGIFESIAAPVPDGFYSIAETSNYLYRFYGAVNKFLENLPEDAVEAYDRYDKAIEWIYSRTLTAMHLNYAPGVSFFRNKDKLAIVWKADYLVGNNVPVWTAQNGEIEMEYAVFVREIEDFGGRFFAAMDTQVELAVAKDWGETKINKEHLVKEQQERRVAFEKKLAVLKGEGVKRTDWDLVNVLITEMFG